MRLYRSIDCVQAPVTRYGEHVSVFHKIQQADTAQTVIWIAAVTPLALVLGALIGIAAFFIHFYMR